MFGIGITIFKLEKGHPNTLETKITKIQWVIGLWDVQLVEWTSPVPVWPEILRGFFFFIAPFILEAMVYCSSYIDLQLLISLKTILLNSCSRLWSHRLLLKSFWYHVSFFVFFFPGWHYHFHCSTYSPQGSQYFRLMLSAQVI